MPEKELFMQGTILVVGLVILSFIISIPCGYLRQSYAKYSFMWFLLIHLPIPFIVLFRLKAGISWHFIPLTLGGSIAGQVVGGLISRRKQQNGKTS